MKAAFWSLRDKIDAQIEAHLKFTRFRRPTPHEIKKSIQIKAKKFLIENLISVIFADSSLKNPCR